MFSWKLDFCCHKDFSTIGTWFWIKSFYSYINLFQKFFFFLQFFLVIFQNDILIRDQCLLKKKKPFSLLKFVILCFNALSNMNLDKIVTSHFSICWILLLARRAWWINKLSVNIMRWRMLWNFLLIINKTWWVFFLFPKKFCFF